MGNRKSGIEILFLRFRKFKCHKNDININILYSCQIFLYLSLLSSIAEKRPLQELIPHQCQILSAMHMMQHTFKYNAKFMPPILPNGTNVALIIKKNKNKNKKQLCQKKKMWHG